MRDRHWQETWEAIFNNARWWQSSNSVPVGSYFELLPPQDSVIVSYHPAWIAWISISPRRAITRWHKRGVTWWRLWGTAWSSPFLETRQKKEIFSQRRRWYVIIKWRITDVNEPIVAPPLSLFTFLSDATDFFLFLHIIPGMLKRWKKKKRMRRLETNPQQSWKGKKKKRKRRRRCCCWCRHKEPKREVKETQKKKKKKKSQREALFRVDPSGKSK